MVAMEAFMGPSTSGLETTGKWDLDCQTHQDDLQLENCLICKIGEFIFTCFDDDVQVILFFVASLEECSDPIVTDVCHFCLGSCIGSAWRLLRIGH